MSGGPSGPRWDSNPPSSKAAEILARVPWRALRSSNGRSNEGLAMLSGAYRSDSRFLAYRESGKRY